MQFAGRVRSFAVMVDVSAKTATLRTASARGTVLFPKDVFARVLAEGSVKGDIVTIAQVAGIQAAKHTSSLLPLCHPLPLDSVRLSIVPEEAVHSFQVSAQVTTSACKTGVEMEALTAVSIACLTIYDMTKSYSHAISIQNIALSYKTGGKSDFAQ